MRYDFLLGILAIIAGVLVIWGILPIAWVVGIFLLVWGILTLMRKR